MSSVRRLMVIGLVGSVTASANAAVLRFDDLVREDHVGEQYAALGVHFAATDFGVVGGIGEGDPGNWSLFGTNGTAFMGFNGVFPTTYAMDMTFDGPVSGIAFDASRSEGSSNGDGLSVAFWLGGNQVSATVITFQAINTWSTISYSGEVDRVTFEGFGTNFHPYGVDNVQFNVPSPGGVLAFAAGGMAAMRRRRTA